MSLSLAWNFYTKKHFEIGSDDQFFCTECPIADWNGEPLILKSKVETLDHGYTINQRINLEIKLFWEIIMRKSFLQKH